jgi:hypothetical protein
VNRNLSLILTLLFAFAGVIFWGIALTGSAAAQSDIPAGSETKCRTCHEDLYHLYDTGKWYCLCGQPRDCTCCHGGDPQTMVAQSAHAGMTANPIAENPGVCQDCHPGDYQERIDQFCAVARIDPLAPPTATLPAFAPVMAGPVEGAQLSPLLRVEPLEPWRVAALSLLGVAGAGVLVFGYRCWKADCLMKTQKHTG